MPTAQLPVLAKPPNPASPQAQEQARARENSGCLYPGDPAAETPGFAWAGGGGGREAWVTLTPRRHPPSAASPAPAGSSALPGTPPTVTTKNVRGAWGIRQGERLLTETPSGQMAVRPEPRQDPWSPRATGPRGRVTAQATYTLLRCRGKPACSSGEAAPALKGSDTQATWRLHTWPPRGCSSDTRRPPRTHVCGKDTARAPEAAPGPAPWRHAFPRSAPPPLQTDHGALGALKAVLLPLSPRLFPLSLRDR